MKNSMVKYMTDNGNVELSPDIIKSYLVPPESKITDEEIGFFLQMCKFQKLNPFMKEIYIVKYGNYPAAFIIAKETFLRRAKKNDTYKGHSVGISDDGKTAWAEVYVKDFAKPIRCEVEYEEYVALKDGKPNKMWSEKPRTMLKKVALVQALRESFPQDLGGLYVDEEIREEVIDVDVTVKEAKTKSGQKKLKEKQKEVAPEPESEEAPSDTPKTEGDEQMIKVVKVTKKTGANKAGKEWTKYTLHTPGGSMFSTFDKKIAEAADKIKGTDTEALVIYEIFSSQGVDYFNISENGFTVID